MDYISREATLECFGDVPMWTGYNEPYSFEVHMALTGITKVIHDTIAQVPAADVEPVVPCKGCEHAERYERTDGTAGYYCGHPQNTFVYGERWDRVFKPVKKPDDFCSFGEPRGAKIGG